MKCRRWRKLAGCCWPAFSGRLARIFSHGPTTQAKSHRRPLRFHALPVAALLGYLIFAELPDPWSIAGTIVIIASALYLMRRGRIEQRGRRQANKED